MKNDEESDFVESFQQTFRDDHKITEETVSSIGYGNDIKRTNSKLVNKYVKEIKNYQKSLAQKQNAMTLFKRVLRDNQPLTNCFILQIEKNI